MSWTPDGRFVYLRMEGSTYAVPLKRGQSLPTLADSGLSSKRALAALPGAILVSDEEVFSGPAPRTYAFMKVATNRNIYRIPVR